MGSSIDQVTAHKPITSQVGVKPSTRQPFEGITHIQTTIRRHRTSISTKQGNNPREVVLELEPQPSRESGILKSAVQNKACGKLVLLGPAGPQRQSKEWRSGRVLSLCLGFLSKDADG